MLHTNTQVLLDIHHFKMNQWTFRGHTRNRRGSGSRPRDASSLIAESPGHARRQGCANFEPQSNLKLSYGIQQETSMCLSRSLVYTNALITLTNIHIILTNSTITHINAYTCILYVLIIWNNFGITMTHCYSKFIRYNTYKMHL